MYSLKSWWKKLSCSKSKLSYKRDRLWHPYLVKKPSCSENNVYNILKDAQRMQEHMKKKKGEVINYMEEKGISLEEYKVSIMYVHDNYQICLLFFDITRTCQGKR